MAEKNNKVNNMFKKNNFKLTFIKSVNLIIYIPILTIILFVKPAYSDWEHIWGEFSVYALTTSGNNIFAGSNNGLYVSTNNGNSWYLNNLFPNGNGNFIKAFAVKGNEIFAGTTSGLYLSTDNGTTWSSALMNDRSVLSLAVNGNNIFAGIRHGTSYDGIYLSTNEGTTWTQILTSNTNINSLSVNGNTIFAGAGDPFNLKWFSGVYTSTNNGSNWVLNSLNDQMVWSVIAIGNVVFAGAENPFNSQYNGLYISNNNGLTWSHTSLNKIVYSFAKSGNTTFAGTDVTSSFYLSSNNGTNWIQKNEGFTTQNIDALCILNNYIFAGIYANSPNGIFRRPLSELIGFTAIQPVSSEIPDKFSLLQNFPNPFNPSTKIGFRIAHSGFVSLIVYDILGTEVSSLVSESLQPGSYAATWDASKYSSGVYYYRINAGDFSQTKKMLLVK